MLKPHGGQQNSPSQQPEGFHRSSFPILLGVNKSLGALPTARGVFVSVAGRHEGGLPRSDGPQPGRGGLPDASPELAASVFVFFAFVGSLCFPLTRQIYIYIYMYFCWGPNSIGCTPPRTSRSSTPRSSRAARCCGSTGTPATLRRSYR